MMKRLLCIILAPFSVVHAAEFTYPIVDTGQSACYDNQSVISPPSAGRAFYGQDAQYKGLRPSYTDNGDGTVTDNRTGLMWIRDPGKKKTYSEAVAGAAACRTGKYDDWRLPAIKELYSLILFTGTDPDLRDSSTVRLKPFIDTDYFVFQYGKAEDGDRIIDSQFVSATRYVSTTMHGDATVFGVNFADGRIKGYGIKHPRTGNEKTFYVLYVRGNPEYGINQFTDNGDGTVTDKATGLMWMKADSGQGMDWEAALAWSEELRLAGHDDWRLPNAKELQSIVDYSRSPKTTRSAALAPVFESAAITDEDGNKNYPFYWSSTTHASLRGGQTAVYVASGEALGWMGPPGQGGGMQRSQSGPVTLLDVHGAGAQRSDPKVGNPEDYPQGRGPQGDVVRINNYVRCVRNAD